MGSLKFFLDFLSYFQFWHITWLWNTIDYWNAIDFWYFPFFLLLICFHWIILNFFYPGHYWHHFVCHFLNTSIYTLIPHYFIYTCTGNTIPFSTIYTWIRNTFNIYFGKPFSPGGFSATDTDGGFLGTLPCGLGCALGTTFGIPASFKSIIFLLFSPSSVDTTYDLGVSALEFTTALYQCLVKVFFTHTCCLGRSCGSSLAWASCLV